MQHERATSVAVLALALAIGCGDGDNTSPTSDGGTDAAVPDGGGFVGCQSAGDCDDGKVCNGMEVCGSDGVCAAGVAVEDGVSCTTQSGADGQCIGGLCAPPDCGNGVVDGTEDCDDGQDGDPDDGCRDDCTFSCEVAADCDDGNPCNGSEACDDGSHACVAGVDVADGTTCGTGMVCLAGQCMARDVRR